ncbi:MAG: cyclic nucleotide-binding domain-containing protein [Chloroflexi bacterium]|nr:cyclic nucleotide-binding domain-containing protein [Chloroflexota bacterium]
MPLSQADAIDRLAELIRQNPATTDLSEDQIVELAHKADIHLYRQGEVLTRQGDQDDRFFVVISGELQVFDDRESPRRLLNYMPVGSPVGLRSVIHGTGIREATVEAEFDSVVAIYNRDDLEWLLRQDPQIEAKIRDLERAYTERSVTDFPGRQPDEIVLAATKRHILAFVAKLIWPIILLIIPVLFLLLAELFGFGLRAIVGGNPGLFILLIAPFVVLSVLMTLYFYFDWINDDLIVTTKRVIHIERILFYSEVREEAPLTHIQNIFYESHDWLDTLFDIDDINIQTAALGKISVDKIPAAQNLVRVILQAQQRALQRATASDREATRRLIAERMNRNLLETPIAVGEPSRKSSQGVGLPKVSLPKIGLGYFVPRTALISTERGDRVITWRKHYLILLRHILLPAIAIMVSLYLFSASLFGWPPFVYQVVWEPLYWLLGLAVLGSLFWYTWEYDSWRRDVYILTSNKIVDKEGTAFRLFGEKVREGNFDSIQSITYDLPNIFYRLINLGDVIIQTAGTGGNFTFKQVFNPSSVQEEIFRRWDAYQKQKREKQRDETTRQVVTVLGEYHDTIVNPIKPQ